MTEPAAHPAVPSTGRPAVSEISALIAWMRRLTGAGLHRAGPAELAAFQHAKQDLLIRIERCSHTPATRYEQPGDSVD